MLRYLLAFSLILLLASCKKDKVKAGNNVEMYLLSSYQAVSGKCQVDSSLSVLQDVPLIRNEEILQYSRSTYAYSLTISAIQKIKNLIGRTPFAITVDRKVIFYGFYMPPIMSSTCFDSITMDAVGFDQTNTMYMRQGYPGALSGVPFDDQRNNLKLIATFSNQGKLK
ncbi:MAG: hypothetical protein ABIN89_05850 [Chitinophagaceae bacterium]